MRNRFLKIAVYAVSMLVSLSACGGKTAATAGKGDGTVVTDFNVPDKEGATVKGIVINAKTRAAMPDVVVSDGRLCTRTDENGMYWLNTDFSTQRCVFVCIPNGYEIPVDKGCCFAAYGKIDLARKDQVQQFNFGLEPMTVSSLRYKVLYVGDPQIRKEIPGSYESFSKLINALAEYKKESDVPVYLVNTGDLTYERPQEHTYFKDQIAMTQIPTFNVPGNHDHIGPLNTWSGLIPSELVDDPAVHTQDYIAVSGYIRDFGPNSYSANIGGIHYLFLDAIIWNEADDSNPDALWGYREGFDEECLEFVENDLKFVDKSTPLCIVTHGPFTKLSGPDGVHNPTWFVNFERFNELIAGYNVHNWAGHLHTAFNYSYFKGTDAEDNIYKAAALETHQIARGTGSLYVECEVTADGVPRGFVVADVDGQDIKWTYKRAEPASENGNDQMQIYTPDEADPYMNDKGYVYVNVFLYDNMWGSPEWYENGVSKGVMVEYHEEGDPMYEMAWDNWRKSSVSDFDKDRDSRGPTKNDTRHLFRIKPSSGVTSGEVRIKDRFGNEWKQTCEW